MTETTTLKDRLDNGRALRKTVPRSAHAAPGSLKRDPVALLKSSSKGRVEALVPLRYGRMLTSPFAFYRGTAIIQAHDLAGTPHTGIIQQICGDCHLMNFGGFATPERTLVFDINDFDETHPGPWEWDLKRLAASLTVASRHLGFKAAVADEVVAAAVQSYQQHMEKYAGMGALEIWYDRLTFDEIAANSISDAARKVVRQTSEKAVGRTSQELLPKMGKKIDGRWVMNDAPPGLFHVHGDSTLFSRDDDWSKLANWEVLSDKFFGEYLETISYSHRQLLNRFTMQDLAFKVVGVGSVGTRCLVLLLSDAQDNPLFLQIKEAGTSVLAPYVPAGKSPFRHQGRRVVAGQRVMQASSDLFLGWTTGPSGRHFYVRQLRDMKVSADIEVFNEALLGRYARVCARSLARGHARSGGLAPEITGYLGNGEQFADAMVKYSNAYADQVQKDFEVFRNACRNGRLVAQSEADFGAGLGV